jgi:hypothetical protein
LKVSRSPTTKQFTDDFGRQIELRISRKPQSVLLMHLALDALHTSNFIPALLSASVRPTKSRGLCFGQYQE